MSFAVVTDQTSGLDPSLVATLRPEHAVAPLLTVPLVVSRVGDRLTTSQPAIAQIREVLRDASDGGRLPVVAPVLSARISGTGQAFRVAAAQEGVTCEVIDTRTVGGALALAALAATCQRDANAAAAVVREMSAKSATGLVVADLKALARGGRLQAPKAALGTALGIVPLIEMRDGALQVTDMVRGRMRARRRLVTRVLEHVTGRGKARNRTIEPVDIAVHCADADDDLIGLVDAALAEAELTVRRRVTMGLPEVLRAHTGDEFWGFALTPAL
ncbi:MAG: DegV family protein [Bowdeniella nasicola]|nr:DegV family protein [Bowdeniella nasicola]